MNSASICLQLSELAGGLCFPAGVGRCARRRVGQASGELGRGSAPDAGWARRSERW